MKNRNRPILAVSDLHLPFAVDGWLEFIEETYKKYNCSQLIINGDLWDFHNASFHETETDADNLITEFEKAKKETSRLVKVFPKLILVQGNHDIRIMRQNKVIGIDARFIKSFHELFELPNTIKIVEDIVINNVYFRHQGCCGGKDGAINSAIANRMSTVVSHLHGNGGVKYSTSPTGESIFGLNTGALIDDNSYATRYAKLNKQKSTLGCGLIYSDQESYFIPKIK